MIDEGYAIDDCGNDLVVCEPLRFDVISKLREYGWLVGDAAYDPCKEPDKQELCKITQCFYITMCYDEEPRDFTTPFIAGCRPSLTECEPTRVREGVRFDVLQQLPDDYTWLEELECRIKYCTKLFTESQFAIALHAELQNVKTAIDGGATPDKKWMELFCTLRGLLLLYLSKYPDKYNCTLDYEIRKILFPEHESEQTGKTLPTVQDTSQPRTQGSSNYALPGQNYGADVGTAFCRLLELANQYVYSCILGEMIFPCKEPCDPSCVVLGTIEVVGDKVTRVCNCPRSYVWSFGSFWEVIIATVLGGIACEEKPTYEPKPAPTPTPTPTTPGVPGTTGFSSAPHASEPIDRGPDTNLHEHPEDDFWKHICCSLPPFVCTEFLDNLEKNQKTIYDTSTAALRLIAALKKSLRFAFDFSRPNVFSPLAFKGMKTTDAEELAKLHNVDLIVQDAPFGPQNLNFLETFRSLTLAGIERPVYAYQTQNRIVDARHDWREAGTLDPAIKTEIDQAANDAKDLDTRVTALETAIYAISKLNSTQDPKLAELRRTIREALAETPTKKGSAKKAPAKRGSARKGQPETGEGENG